MTGECREAGERELGKGRWEDTVRRDGISKRRRGGYREERGRSVCRRKEDGMGGGGGGGGGMLGPGGFTKMDMMELDGQVVEGWRDGGMLEDGGLEGRRDLEDVARRDMARTLKELKARHPDRDTEQLIEMANYQVHSL